MSIYEQKKSLQEAKKQISGRLSKISEQKEQISEKKGDVKTQRKKLKEAREKLPNYTSAKALRSGGQFSGMQGRIQRRQLRKKEEDISEQRSVLGNYLGQLKGYREQKLIPAEKQLKKQKSKVQSGLRDIKEFETAKLLYQEGKGSLAMGMGGDVWSYYKDFKESERQAERAIEEKYEEDPTKELKSIDVTPYGEVKGEFISKEGKDKVKTGDDISEPKLNLRLGDRTSDTKTQSRWDKAWKNMSGTGFIPSVSAASTQRSGITGMSVSGQTLEKQQVDGVTKQGTVTAAPDRNIFQKAWSKIQQTPTAQYIKRKTGTSQDIKENIETQVETVGKPVKQAVDFSKPDISRKQINLPDTTSPIGTGITRTQIDQQKTLQEIQREQANVPEDQNILTADTGKLRDQYKNIQESSQKLQNISKNIDKRIQQINQSGANVTRNKQTGEYKINLPPEEKRSKKLKSQLESLQKQQEKADIERQRIKAYGGRITEEGKIEYPQITEGFFGLDEKVSTKKYIPSLQRDPTGGLSSGITAFGRGVGRTLGEGAEEAYVATGKASVDLFGNRTMTTIRTSPEGTSTYNPITGKAQLEKTKTEITKESFEETRPEFLGEGFATAGGITGTAVQYASPYSSFALGTLGLSKGEKEAGSIGGYFRERPLEAGFNTLAVAAPVGAAGLRGVRGVRAGRRARAVEEATEDVSQQTLKYGQMVDLGGGSVKMSGYQTGKYGERYIELFGRLKKSGKGYRFMPEGTGTSTLTSNVGKRRGFFDRLAEKEGQKGIEGGIFSRLSKFSRRFKEDRLVNLKQKFKVGS